VRLGARVPNFAEVSDFWAGAQGVEVGFEVLRPVTVYGSPPLGGTSWHIPAGGPRKLILEFLNTGSKEGQKLPQAPGVSL